MSKKTKLLDGSWSECSPSSASYSSPTFSLPESLSSSSSVSDFSVDQTLSSGKTMEVISHRNSDYGDERFLGLPFEIWTQIFRYAGFICPCPIDLVTVNHRPAGSSAGKRGHGNSSHAMMRALSTDIVTCALHRSSFEASCVHNSFLPMLAVSSQARQFTRKAIFQESLLVFTLRTVEDLMGLKQTLRGFVRMAPLEHSLKRIQVVLESHDRRRLKATHQKRTAINHYKAFCDYVRDNLQGTLKDYVFKCRVGDETVASELVGKMRNNFQMLNSCAFRFEYSGPGSILGIARDAAVKTIMCNEHTAQPFRFMGLPNEIKEMILKEVLVGRWDPIGRNSITMLCGLLSSFRQCLLLSLYGVVFNLMYLLHFTSPDILD
ncbi:hypothetical protein PISL3812_03053 [Talaromyces islandicus]|uniref:Uncharacterized protein n=1 Tax=Talaromyces islandicus TaxID=28573 RepID=A0A0U1LTY3_TALIS|nr:hypothetical protein PISL3812_03053 [Talaromyces islandicus]